jgi:mRNA interferase HigB
MHIITRKRLNEFAEKHPEARSALQHWYRLMKSRNFASFVDVRAVFPSADQVGKLTVFNIGGNQARLIAAIHYNRRKCYIRAVLTHDEYDRGRWKEYSAMTTTIQQVEALWPPLSEVLRVPHSEQEYREIVSMLDRLIDLVGEDENHPLASLMEVLGVLIEKYEDDHVAPITEL